MTYQILTPDLQGKAEFVWLETEPGEGGVEFFSHERGEECILILEGVLHVFIQVENEDRIFVLNKGDCLTFDARLPHRYANEGAEKAVWVYIAVPPAL
jgi:mannose-6-phosphate isomerase-like protein (cupin superfamily)